MARKAVLSNITEHEHSLQHLLLIAASMGLLDQFTENLKHGSNDFDYADVLMAQDNLTIFSAFPWHQSPEGGETWRNLKHEVQNSARYAFFKEVSNE